MVVFRFVIDLRPPSGYNQEQEDGQPVAPGWRSILSQVYSLEKCRLPNALGGGYFFIWLPNETAAITSVSNAMTSNALIGLASFDSCVEDWPRPLAGFVITY